MTFIVVNAIILHVEHNLLTAVGNLCTNYYNRKRIEFLILLWFVKIWKLLLLVVPPLTCSFLQVKTVTRSDKQDILFYRDTSVECTISSDFKELWNTISVKEISENDIENYLKRVGIATMEGYGMKKKAATKKKPVKRKRNVKMLNSHLDSKMLKEFDWILYFSLFCCSFFIALAATRCFMILNWY